MRALVLFFYVIRGVFRKFFPAFEHFVDQSISGGFLTGHVIIAVGIFFNLLFGFASVFGKNGVETLFEVDHKPKCALDIGCCALGSAGDLMDHDVGVGEAEAFASCPCGEKHCTHGGCNSDAVSIYITGQELHGVVDRQTGSYGASGGVNVNVDVLFRVLHLQEEKLGDDGVGYAIVNTCADKDNPVFQKAGVDVVSAFATAIRFDDGGDVVAVLWCGIHGGRESGIR